MKLLEQQRNLLKEQNDLNKKIELQIEDNKKQLSIIANYIKPLIKEIYESDGEINITINPELENPHFYLLNESFDSEWSYYYKFRLKYELLTNDISAYYSKTFRESGYATQHVNLFVSLSTLNKFKEKINEIVKLKSEK